MEVLEELIKQKKNSMSNLITLIGLNFFAGVMPFGVGYTISGDNNPDILYATFSSIAIMGFSIYSTLDKIFVEVINYEDIKKKIDSLS